MRSILTIFLFFLIVENIQAGSVEILHSHCNSSGTTFTSPKCDINSKSGKVEINIEFDVPKKVKKLLVRFKIF